MGKILDALNACAGLFGFCGVAAAAAAAHVSGAENLRSVALILLVHAAALLAITARAREASPGARLWFVSALAIALGAALFSAAVTLLTLRGPGPFLWAAPVGGTTTMLGWLVVCAAGLVDLFRRYP
ncbi:DUF423 domain-containing protein [Rhodoblastus acidophilus]|uniref:DUF423 domain-containing protein n=1 Tax=Candidatus Rhodoblastus alkanivorans TaxID=2954117 RepID=A0ABS9ZAV1_9HYPH|nr:DUF423 domain-containing protein [Candidatus Rhodoblastus alkanivorans]MCI4679826.1 DUF423 domain-containing protein [Candidatus Rhodoblastus alkanivorans]MCI4684332.1 DUF423 domain-containing protein [Candidatus Rhodoblastus alkanivorans]MDI4641653.1 DUF423 domain-containing protein [Rhodoblastus acidophilus]